LTPRPSIMEIAKIMGYPKANVGEKHQKLKDKGELDAIHSDVIS